METHKIKTIEELKIDGDKEFDNTFLTPYVDSKGWSLPRIAYYWEESGKKVEWEDMEKELKLFIQQREQKSYTLGMMKGVEMVEGVVPEEMESRSDRQWIEDYYDKKGFNKCREQILSNITNLKQELK